MVAEPVEVSASQKPSCFDTTALLSTQQPQVQVDFLVEFQVRNCIIIYFIFRSFLKLLKILIKLLSPQNFLKKGFGLFSSGILRAKIATDGDLRVDLGEKQDVFRE